MGFPDIIEMKRMAGVREAAKNLASCEIEELSQIVREAHETEMSDPEGFKDKYVDPAVVDGIFKRRRLPTEEGYKVMAATNILAEREGAEYVLGLSGKRLPKGFRERFTRFCTGEYPSL